MELKFRTLRADEIECRVGQIKDKGFTLLLYKNARVDMALLDEQVGVGKWQRKHEILGNDIYCSVGIWNEELKQFVWYEDAGSSGGIEEEKSKASNSFKRACVNVGIGRELYSAPFIYISTTEDNQPKSMISYSVKEISYNNKREINKLTIVNDKTGEIVYSYPKNAKVSQNVPKEPKTSVNNLIDNSLQHEDTITQEDLNTIEAYLLTIKGNDMKTHAFNEYLINTFNVYSAKNLNFADGRKVAEFCRKKLANGK